jgi:MFS family permease
MNALWLLYAASLLMDMSVAGVMFAVSRRAAELGASAGALGLLASAWLGPYVVVSLVSGRLSDRWGRRRVALIGPVVTCVITVLCAFITDVNWLVAITAVFGLGLGCYWPPLMAWITDGAIGAELHRRLTRFGVAWNIGLFLGFGLTGYVFKHWPVLAFILPASALLLIVALLLLAKPGAASSSAQIAATALERPPAGRGFRKTGWLANFGVQLATAGATAIFPQLATHLGIAADAHGGLLAVARAAALTMIIALQLLTFWHSRLWPLWLAQALCVGAVASLGWLSHAGIFIVAFAAMGAVTGYSYQASIYFTLDEMNERGKGTGFHEAFLASGMLIGPVLGGWAGNAFGLRAPYFACAAALVLGLAAQVAVVLRQRARPPA